MRVKISYLKIIMIMIACTALYFMICPWYVKGVAGIYTRNFADVLNSHNTKSYDRFFFPKIPYLNSTESRLHMQMRKKIWKRCRHSPADFPMDIWKSGLIAKNFLRLQSVKNILFVLDCRLLPNSPQRGTPSVRRCRTSLKAVADTE